MRIRDKQPIILEDVCIDCGACIASCPRKAVVPDVDSFKVASLFKYRVAVPSPVLYAQFGLDISVREIHLALNVLGFDYIYDVFAACLIEAMAIEKHLSNSGGANRKPLISAMCPAVVRLIQVKYPSLVGSVLPFEPPRELSAREAKIKIAHKHGVEIADVGAFYISPCPAKSVSILQPAEKEHSFLDGAYAISDIYIPLHKAIKNLKPEAIAAFPQEACVFGSGWERTGFMSRSLNVRNWIAVSGLPHVVSILDHLEEGKLEGVAFVEANACMEGCVGGALCVENLYVARSKTLMMERDHDPITKPDDNWVAQLYNNGYFFMEKELKPRRRKGPASSIPERILRMKRRDELSRKLPGLDCCACGSPSCLSFAEDVIGQHTDLKSCPFLSETNIKIDGDHRTPES